jgi:phenylpropionate dioxygenase-like ring-hydroxylating dioxygenase large terminal subunit
MDLLGDDIWRRFWYPVGYIEDLAAGPMARTVLGTRLVVWAGPDGGPVAAVDRCPHRDAPLSQGWTADGCIVCPYHGWQFGVDGKAAKVPQTPELRSFPERFQVQTVRAASRFGVTWVSLEEPVRPIPDLPNGDVQGWRTVREFDEEWAAPAARLMENSFDPAHTVFVHRATFGDTARPDVAVPSVERTPYGMVIRSDVSVANPGIARAVTGETAAKTVRSSETELHGPFLRVLTSRYPSGAVHQIVTAATPVDNDRLRLVQWAVRNDTEADAPAADVVAFDRQVTWEDQRLLEGIWAPYSASLDVNVHIKVDRPTVEMRRIYQEIADRTWAGLTPAPEPLVVA